MNETRQGTEHDNQGGQDGGHEGGMNAMGLLMAGSTGLLVAILLVPSLGWPLGIGVAVLAGVVMLRMHGGVMCGPGGTTGHRRGGC
ncbi:MAG TPA: hypothetical protein VJB57_04290 [Dehalococcoidia bacterium]|nr:hypothetical protein [Dehalococcoidia bacterium]